MRNIHSYLRRWRSPLATFEYTSLLLLVVYNILFVLGAVGFAPPIVRPVLAFLLTGVVLGGLTLRLIGVDPAPCARWVVYAQGTGMVTLLLAGLIVNAGLPPLGYGRPISPLPLVLTLNVLVVGTASFSLAIRDEPSAIRNVASVLSWSDIRPSVLLLGTLPLVTVLAVTYLNLTNDAIPILVVLFVVAVLPACAVCYVTNARYYAFAVFTMSLAILLHKSLWLGQNYGGHASVVSIYQQGVWSFGGESLAVNAVLMPTLGHLSGLPILTYIRVIMPVLVAFIPVCLFVTFRRYTDAEVAFLGVALFTFLHPFYYQYPNTPRASMPVFFLALLGLLICDDVHDRFQRYLMAITFAFGIITSHYGTSYYVMFALVGALVAIRAYRMIDDLTVGTSRLSLVVPDRFQPGDTAGVGSVSRVAIVTREFVGYYVAAIIAYYYFVDDGKVYAILVENVINAYLSLFVENSDGGGATATRLTTDYGGLSIAYSKYLYLLVAMAIGVGLVVVHWDRIAPWRETTFDDDYIAVSSLLLALFGGTIFISGQWGGGRPMMIVLSFNAVFAVVGVVWISRSLKRVGSLIAARLGLDPGAVDARLAGRVAFAALLATMFVLNTGTMAAVAYGGAAPSEVPNTDLSDNTDASNMGVHVFFTDHRNVSEQIFADRGTRQRATDWRNGEIAAHAEREPYRFKPKSDLGAINNSDLERGYVVLLAHNLEEGIVDVNFVTNRPIERYDLGLEHRHRVYSNGRGAVYYTDEAAQRLARDGDDSG